MMPRDRTRVGHGSATDRGTQAAYYQRYLECLERTGATLIAQAKKLEVMTDAAVCAVAGGAAGLAVVFLYVSQMNLGEVEKFGACSSIPLFFACGGLILGRFLPGKAVRVRQDDLRRITQEQATGWQHIDKVTVELDALPKRKENSTRRQELERRLTVLRDRDAALTAQIQQLEDRSSGGVFLGPFRHAERVAWSGNQRDTREDEPTNAAQAIAGTRRSHLEDQPRPRVLPTIEKEPDDLGDDKRETGNRGTDVEQGYLVPPPANRDSAERPSGI
jgi:hypothetical protein